MWEINQLCNFTLINLVSISPSEASSWCLSTYFWHLDRAFSLGVDTLIAFGMIGCKTVSRSKLQGGLWSTHFSPPAECERLCIGWTGRAVWWSHCERGKKNQEVIHKWLQHDSFKTVWNGAECSASEEWQLSHKINVALKDRWANTVDGFTELILWPSSDTYILIQHSN